MHLPSFLGRPSRAQRFLPPMIVTPPPSPRKTPSTTSRPGRMIRTGVPPLTRRHFRTVIAHHPHITIRHRTIEVTVDPIITIPVAVGNLTTAAVAATTEVATIPLPRSETSRPVLLLLTKTNTRKSQLPGKMSCSRRAICPDQRSTCRPPRVTTSMVPQRRRRRPPMEVISPPAAGASRRRNRSRRIRPT